MTFPLASVPFPPFTQWVPLGVYVSVYPPPLWVPLGVYVSCHSVWYNPPPFFDLMMFVKRPGQSRRVDWAWLV